MTMLPDVGNGTTPLQVWSMANVSLSNIYLFLHLLWHPYILTIFVDNFFTYIKQAIYSVLGYKIPDNSTVLKTVCLSR